MTPRNESFKTKDRTSSGLLFACYAYAYCFALAMA